MGYNSTFELRADHGYKDHSNSGGDKRFTARYSYRSSKATILGGHLKASSALTSPARDNQFESDDAEKTEVTDINENNFSFCFLLEHSFNKRGY